MSFYNMLFGRNPQSALLLAAIGLREHDVERFRDVYVGEGGKTLEVYTRTGGGNREAYPNRTMRKLPNWCGSVDDDFDNTYCTDTFDVPAEFVDDVKALADVIGNGLRAEFGQHLLRTLRRAPTEKDLEAAAYEAEKREISSTKHLMANGHTFVPMDDQAMLVALRLAEKNGGELRSCWGILPITIDVKRNFVAAVNENTRKAITRVEVGINHRWTIDEDYWEHCRVLWSKEFPLSMSKIAERVQRHRGTER